MIYIKSRLLTIMVLGCLGWLSLSFMPAIADEPCAPESEASSGWPTMPLPNPGDASDLLKSSENQGGALAMPNDEVTSEKEVKLSSSTQAESGSQGNISSITNEVQSIPDPSANEEELQQVRPPAVIVRTYQRSQTLNASKDQRKIQGSADIKSK